MEFIEKKNNNNKNNRNKYVEKVSKRNLGILGENFAVNYLKENNYIILERNFRFSRFGEIDIIAMDNEYICFIEVKTRTRNNFGTPSEAVNKSKQTKIKMMAQIYINRKKLFNKNIRFDIIEVFLDNITEKEEFKLKNINLIKNAFY